MLALADVAHMLVRPVPLGALGRLVEAAEGHVLRVRPIALNVSVEVPVLPAWDLAHVPHVRLQLGMVLEPPRRGRVAVAQLVWVTPTDGADVLAHRSLVWSLERREGTPSSRVVGVMRKCLCWASRQGGSRGVIALIRVFTWANVVRLHTNHQANTP